jgi:hypothetical protein
VRSKKPNLDCDQLKPKSGSKLSKLPHFQSAFGAKPKPAHGKRIRAIRGVFPDKLIHTSDCFDRLLVV